VQTLPTLSGFSSSTVTNRYDSLYPTFTTLGPFVQLGKAPADCSPLLAPTPSLSGLGVGTVFPALNQTNIGDTVTTDVQWSQ
jgi:hypothetical protein